MNSSLKLASDLILRLEGENLLLSIDKISPLIFRTHLEKTEGWGISLLSPHLALLRSLGEVIERFAGDWGKQAKVVSGEAAGENATSAKIAGLYELVERDAFMTHILTEIPPRHIKIETLPFRWMNNIQKLFNEDSLSFHLLDISHDLEIPSYVSVFIQGKQTIVSIGLKSNMIREHAVLGSIEEATLEWVINKNHLHLHRTYSNQDQMFLKNPLQRFLKNSFTLYKNSPSQEYSPKNELACLYEKLTCKGIEMDSSNITPHFLQNSQFSVQKVLAPKLQPLFLLEKDREVRPQRLQEVKEYFKNIAQERL